VQPVYIDDLRDLVLALLDAPPAPVRTITAAGPEPITVRDFLATLRGAMGLGRHAHLLPPFMA